ncbi:MAG: GrpB family protein [Anaerolineae bacterium]|nr:GrpB family protein [Anaerolineae bacterium]
MKVIITGPCSIGKTSVAEELTVHFYRAVMLDGDALGAVHPFEIYDDHRIDYLYRTRAYLVDFHIREGHYHNFVIPYVFETPESLADLRKRLSVYDDEIYAFRLTAADSAIEDRIIRREGRDGEDVTWYFNRYRELVAIQDNAARYGDMGFEIDTTGCSARQVGNIIWDNLHERILLVPYDPQWEEAYAAERDLITEALRKRILAVHHIGSTAVHGLPAKPIIDIMVVVSNLSEAQHLIVPLRNLGYSYVNNLQNKDRWFFRKGVPRTHHIHVVESGSDALKDHLDFRDALRYDRQLRDAYAELKTALAVQFDTKRAQYAEHKGQFITQTLKNWRR